MGTKRNRYYYLKYCLKSKKLVVRSENRIFRKVLDAFLSFQACIQEALKRGYDYLFVTSLPPQSFNADLGDSSIADILDSSISVDHADEPDFVHFILSDFDTGFLEDNSFNDDPARGMWDITSIYYSMMHTDSHDS